MNHRNLYFARQLASCTTYLLGVEKFANIDVLFNKVISLQQGIWDDEEGWMDWAKQIVWTAAYALGYSF